MEQITKVIFRRGRAKSDDEVFAVFPTEPGRDEYDFTIYVHQGQHGTGTRRGCINSKTRLATPAEYADLKRELEHIGYRLKVVKRISPKDDQARRDEVRRWYA